MTYPPLRQSMYWLLANPLPAGMRNAMMWQLLSLPWLPHLVTPVPAAVGAGC